MLSTASRRSQARKSASRRATGAAEEARIRQTAEIERQRLVDQAQREIDLRLETARRELTRYAAELPVEVASARLKADMTDADQQRLVDRYVSEVGSARA